jgi:hypothetical protein
MKARREKVFTVPVSKSGREIAFRRVQKNVAGFGRCCLAEKIEMDGYWLLRRLLVGGAVGAGKARLICADLL